MDKSMMQKAAKEAMKSLEGLDASKIKAVSIIFQGGKGKPEEMGEPEMEDEMEDEYEEEGSTCPSCGKTKGK